MIMANSSEVVFSLVLLMNFVSTIHSQQLAFPTAEGYGKYAAGGRGGKIYEVTTLNPTGPGSLGAAIGASGPRTVVFRVAGTIEGSFNIRNDNITIAGQTAPGDGICIKGDLGVSADHVIIRYIRVRQNTAANSESDAIGGRGHHDIILDHVSASWSGDEVMSLYQNSNVTIQWCMITEACAKFVNGENTGHRFGGIWGNNYGTYHHNLIVHNDSRNPRWASDCGRNDYRNNVIYNWGYNSCYGGEGNTTINMIANYYKPGPGTRSGVRDRIAAPGSGGSWYVSDNYVVGYPAVTNNNWLGMDGSSFTQQTKPWSAMAIIQQTPEDAYSAVLDHAGCSLPNRDAVDARIIEEIRNGTATYGNDGIITTPGDVGGWPELESAPAPTDSDHDGMPDEWESRYGLDSNDAADGSQDKDGDGYTNVEEYINGLVKSIDKAVRIMPLGDSITAGEHYGYPAFGERTGYRKPLYELLAANAYDVDFVGSLNWGFDIVPPFDCDHEGHPGWSARQITSNICGWLEQNPADIILAHVGTNGLSVDNDEDVERMLDEIDRYEIDNDVEITVFLARIIHRYEMDANATTTAFNEAIEAMVLSRVQNLDDKIIVVDMENGAGIDYMTDGLDMIGTTYPGVGYDRYHPSDQGNIKMAELWFEHLENFLSPPYSAHRPYPQNGSCQWPPAFTGFRWSIPEPRHPGDVVTCNVYVGMDPNAPVLIVADDPNDFLSSDVYPIIPDTNYCWRVDCIDPNAGHPVLTEGRAWTFHTFDPVPDVYAGKDQSERLPHRDRPLILQIDATVIDEGDPNTVLYYLWSVESAPADTPDIVFDDNAIEDPLVTFSAAGEYILRLSASDDGPVESQDSNDIGSDTVTITVDHPTNPRPR